MIIVDRLAWKLKKKIKMEWKLIDCMEIDRKIKDGTEIDRKIKKCTETERCPLFIYFLIMFSRNPERRVHRSITFDHVTIIS